MDFDLKYIKKFQQAPYFIAGCDEVGRGPLAGPVVAACVLVAVNDDHGGLDEFIELLSSWKEKGIGDSKKIKEEKRQEIINGFLEFGPRSSPLDVMGTKRVFEIKRGRNLRVLLAIDAVGPNEIDQINILQASLLAMEKSLGYILKNELEYMENGIVLIDGNRKFKLNQDVFFKKNIELETVVKGDSQSLLIGLASLFAKVYRDQLMRDFAITYPGFGWEKNAGYPTSEHLSAIARLGVTPLHRKTFKGVKEVVNVFGQG